MKTGNKVLNSTTNSREYKLLHGSQVSGCGWCMPHKGCNRHHYGREVRSWKDYRGFQWKNEISE